MGKDAFCGFVPMIGNNVKMKQIPHIGNITDVSEKSSMLTGSSVVPSLALTLSWKTTGGFSRDSSSHFFCETFSASLTQALLLPAAIITYPPYVILLCTVAID